MSPQRSGVMSTRETGGRREERDLYKSGGAERKERSGREMSESHENAEKSEGKGRQGSLGTKHRH
jgi:hypothetical protein